MKEYTKGNILLNDLGGGFYLYRYDEYVENFTKQDLLDLHSLLSEILETPTVKEENPYCKCGRCLACDGCHFMKVNCTCQPVTPPSNSEKEEVKEDTKKECKHPSWMTNCIAGAKTVCTQCGIEAESEPPKEPVNKPRKINIVGLEMAGRSRDDIRYIIVDTVNDIIDYLDETK